MKSFHTPEMELFPDEEINCFMDGRLKLIQSVNGYRFSIDAAFLSEFVTIRPDDEVVDLGTGCGIIPLLLLLTRPVARITGIEIQEDLARQAGRNAALNGFSDRMKIIRGDIRHPCIRETSADVIVCNPPYRKVDSGRINPDPRRAIARHELLASVDDILATACLLLRRKGRLAMIYPAERMADILEHMRHRRLEPKRVRVNYPDKDSNAELVLIEAVKEGRPGLEILPPLMGQGDFTIRS